MIRIIKKKLLFIVLTLTQVISAHEQKIEALNIAIANNDTALFAKIIKDKLDLNKKTSNLIHPTHPLFNAIFFGRVDMAQKLLENGADVNFKDYCGASAFDCTKHMISGSRLDKLEIIKLLVIAQEAKIADLNLELEKIKSAKLKIIGVGSITIGNYKKL